RKRGRPAKTEAPAQVETGPRAAVPEEPELKRKRGRPSLSQQKEQEETGNAEVAPAEEPKPKQRGRPPLSQQNALAKDNAEVVAVVNIPPRKRGRPSLLQSQEHGQKDAPEDGPEAAQVSQPRKRGRPPKDTQAKGAVNEAEENVAGKPLRRQKVKKRGQPSPENRPTAVTDEAEGSSSTKSRRRGRVSLDEQHQEEASEKPVSKEKKRGRPSRTEKEADAAPVVKQTRRGRRSKEQTLVQEQESAAEEAPLRKSKPRTSHTSQLKKPRRSSQPQGQSRSPSPESESSPAPYRHLTIRTRQVPRDIINHKWSPLDAASISSVTKLLHSASRPVLIRLNNLQKHAEATAALNAVSNRLRSKLTRGLPFPPATTAHRREDDLEFERTIDGIQTLEAQLNPLLHSVGLLKKEKERAEKDLEREYKVLNSLSANARSEAKGRREQLRKMHALVPGLKKGGHSNDPGGLGELLPAENGTGKMFVDLEDEELGGLAAQLGNHMESMRGNLQQIDGVAPAIAESRAALRMALLPHLDRDSFEHVLLG
ncbi:CENP-Q, a CENPA-CAD centromere complex subunit-domain-containing protein, partial [Xylariales sp. AK1849]